MNRTFALLSFSLTASLAGALTACGSVIEPEPPEAPEAAVAYPEEPALDRSIDPPSAPPLLLEAPRAATTPSSLFGMTFSTAASLEHVVQTSAPETLDIVEQRIVTTTDAAVQLVIELEPPTGTYERMIVSDVIQGTTVHTNHVLCESGNLATYDPRCNQVRPGTRERPHTGTLSAATWSLRVLDDETGVALSTCVAASPHQIDCTLPARASASYRVVASTQGFSELWDGSPGFGRQLLALTPFTGAWTTSDWQCWDWRVSGSAIYCAARYEFRRFNALDEARLELDPITVRITANGATTAMASPALLWDAGNDDLPGAY